MRSVAYIIALWLIVLIAQSVAFAKGTIEHIQMTSQILADAGQPASRELSIYLPDGYESSVKAYPVLYLLHGSNSNNRLWLTYGAVDIIDELMVSGQVIPMIVVMPYMGPNNRVVEFEEDYLIQEIIPFVDENYHTVPHRETRVIAGASRGGADALRLAVSYPELFSLVGGYSSGMAVSLPGRGLLEDHDQESFPLKFCIYCGRNDELGLIDTNREFAKILDEVGLPYVYVEDDGGHYDVASYAQRVTHSLLFFSENLVGGLTSVELHSGAVTTWGEIKLGE